MVTRLLLSAVECQVIGNIATKARGDGDGGQPKTKELTDNFASIPFSSS
jgi:hypothetical protein